jgi:tetratricopeptide (TPR) repeat protein
MILQRFVFLATALAVLLPSHVGAQTPTVDDLVATGLRQLAEARSAPAGPAHAAATDTFDRILIKEPNHPLALMSRGELKFLRARVLVVQGQIAPSVTLFQAGIADMDRAITIAPDRLDLRLTRGLAYGPFPALYNLAPIVRGDLETATRHADFGSLPVAQRTRVWLLLGNAYANAKQRDEAIDAYRKASELDASSASGREADGRLKALLANAPYRPDRFPNVSAAASPLLVVVSFTRASAASDNTQELMKQTMTALERFSGLLAQRLATSVDTPGQYLLFTWWKDKQSVDDFYYSDFHQQLAGGRGQALTNGTTFQANQMPTQLGIEVLAPLPGGMQMGGGFIPRELFQQLPRLPGATQ